MAKPAKKKVESTSVPVKSKKPKFKGLNHPKDCPKAFRSSGNKEIIKAYLGGQKKKRHD